MSARKALRELLELGAVDGAAELLGPRVGEAPSAEGAGEARLERVGLELVNRTLAQFEVPHDMPPEKVCYRSCC